MHMMGSGNRIDGATSPFIQQSFLVLLHYKSSHLVPFQGNASLDFQPIAFSLFLHVIPKKIGLPFCYSGDSRLKPFHTYILVQQIELTVEVHVTNSTPCRRRLDVTNNLS